MVETTEPISGRGEPNSDTPKERTQLARDLLPILNTYIESPGSHEGQQAKKRLLSEGGSFTMTEDTLFHDGLNTHPETFRPILEFYANLH